MKSAIGILYNKAYEVAKRDGNRSWKYIVMLNNSQGGATFIVFSNRIRLKMWFDLNNFRFGSEITTTKGLSKEYPFYMKEYNLIERT